MQRQSFGSPIFKLHGHGGDDTVISEDPKRRVVGDDADKCKATKPRLLPLTPSCVVRPLSSGPERFIHLIPVLTLLCFLILYLFSHNTSLSDLADGLLKHSSEQQDSSEISNTRGKGFFEVRIGDDLAIRSMRNLQELENHAPKSRSHRKIADF